MVNSPKLKTRQETSSFVSGASGDKHWLLSVTNGTIYTTHSTPIKSKASNLTPGLCEYFHWINALKSSEVCFTSRRRFSTCAQSLVVYYIICFFICFPFILLFLKLYLSFILPEELKKEKKRRSFFRSIVLFLFFGRRQGEILSPLSLILFINYVFLYQISSFIWLHSICKQCRCRKKYAARCEHLRFFFLITKPGVCFFMHITIICSKFSMRFTAWVTFSFFFLY